ncbi:TIR domain-containing adapter molecule 1 [Heliangelus exortis]|uniref:TIR domain-containing adapter molecule 1 n=1 Tax=Heliangelus exortis TaxID=472823 RepID=UPI003A908927
MAQRADLQPSFEDIFNILSQMPQEKLLSLQYKLSQQTLPSNKLLQAMVLLTLGQEVDARICLDSLRGNQAAQYVHQSKLGAAGGQEDGKDLQPPQLDAEAMALLAQIYSVLREEKLCSQEAVEKAHQIATKACDTNKGTGGHTLNRVPVEDQEEPGSALSVDRFQTLRSDLEVGFHQLPSPHHVVGSSPVQIGGNSDPSGPQPLCSLGSSSFSSCFEISTSPTVAFLTQPFPHQSDPLCQGSTSGAGQLDRDGQSSQETSRASRSRSLSGQDKGAQVPQPEEVLQVGSSHPGLHVPKRQLPSLGAVNQPVESSDVWLDVESTAAAKPPIMKGNTDTKQDEKLSSRGLPDSRASLDTGPAHIPRKDSHVPVGISSNTATASMSACSFPPPTYSFASTLPCPPQGAPSNLSYPSPLYSSPSPVLSPLQTVEAMPISEPGGGMFFSFVVLHAGEDEMVAHRVKNLLENMGIPNGATLCEDFLIAGHSHMSCLQNAIENSAFIILLLTKNFPCDLCMFQTNTVLMESIQNPSKRYSVIPFLPKENPLEPSQIPRMLGGLVHLDENSLGFSRKVQKTFTTSRIKERKARWDLMQREKLQQNLGALNLGCQAQGPPAAAQPQLLEQPPQKWHPPRSAVPSATHPPSLAGYPMSAQTGPPPFQTLHLPSGHSNVQPGPGGIPALIIQHARMVQIGNHNVMQVETITPGPQDREEETKEKA